MAELVKCNKATQKCQKDTKTHGPCPHAVFHEPEENWLEKLCTEGDFCDTPYENHNCGTIRMRCMTKEELKNWHIEANKFRKEIDKISKRYKITLEDLL